jgi:hypothetical protein
VTLWPSLRHYTGVSQSAHCIEAGSPQFAPDQMKCAIHT